MPQKAFEGGILHVRAYAIFPEMPQKAFVGGISHVTAYAIFLKCPKIEQFQFFSFFLFEI